MIWSLRLPFMAAAFAGAFFCGSSAQALESPWVEASHAEIRLLADAGANPGIRAGIEIKLAPGWKTFWRYPGDAGVPPRFDWSGSENLAAAEIHWPAPERFVDNSGTKSIGYHDRVVFPVSIRAANPALPVKLKLKLDFAVCEKLCVPADAQLSLDVPLELDGLSELLEQAGATVPRRAPFGQNEGLAITKIDIDRSAKPHAVIEVSVPQDIPVELFAEGPSDKWALPLPEKISEAANKLRFSLDFEGAAPPGVAPIPEKLVLTLVAGQAIEVEVPLE